MHPSLVLELPAEPSLFALSSLSPSLSFFDRRAFALHSLSAMATRSNPFDDPAGPGVMSADSDDAATPSFPPASAPAAISLDTVDVESELPDGLSVDRNATLTLGTDALIVLDEGLKYRSYGGSISCCGLSVRKPWAKTTHAIPFYNVLWAEVKDFEVEIKYAQKTGKASCRVGSINYALTDKSLHANAKRWVERLMLRAYPPRTQRRKRIKMLVNPFGGQGNAMRIWTREVEPLFAAAGCEIGVEKTAYRAHAVEIAEKLDIEQYDVVAAASGDGLPHEVFNGLARQKNARRALRKIAVVQIPCGSGNAMSLNLNGTDSPSLAALAIVKGVRSPMDLVCVTQGKEKIWSFLSQATGLVAETDLGTESLRWMGSFRFTWGALVRLLARSVYPAEVSVAFEESDKTAIKDAYRNAVEEQDAARSKSIEPENFDAELSDPKQGELPPLRFGTVNDPLPSTFETRDMPDLGNFYVGNMCFMSPDAPFFATSLPSDGKLDMINISGLISQTRGLAMLATLGDGGLIDFPEVHYSKVSAYRISPRVHDVEGKGRMKVKVGQWLGGGRKQREGLIAVDGESMPFAPFQAEVVRGLGTVLSKRGAVYEFAGPPSVGKDK